jgi:protein TonB
VVTNVFKPSYPSRCKRQGHEGTTVLEVTILSKGKCGNIEIIKSAGCESLDKAAIKALKRAKYIPAKRLGVPFTTTKKIAFNFKLEDYQ